jgi:hypothetical protein
MKRELHVRFCERLEGENPSCLLSAFAVKNAFPNFAPIFIIKHARHALTAFVVTPC